MDMTVAVPLVGLIALAMAGIFAKLVLSQETGTKRMQEIAAAIQEGASAYLNRQYRTIAVFAVILTVILGLALGWKIAAGFIAGAASSAAAGYLGMNTSVRANVRTAAAAMKHGLEKAFRIAVWGGAVTGLAVVGLGLLGISIFYLLYDKDPRLIVGFAFGASLISLFARIGGGIYTKAADVGADLVGKVEAGIPEDDPRNPAVIADNVGDNVGDCAGMGADLFETYAVTIIGAMVLGFLTMHDAKYVEYPLLIGAVAILASILGVFAAKIGRDGKIMKALYKGVATSIVLTAVGLFAVVKALKLEMGIYYASLIGLVITIAILAITEYYTSTNFKPVRFIATNSQTGYATNIISGLAVGLESPVLVALVLSAGILGSYFIAEAYGVEGVYGVSIAVAAMIALTGIIVTLDTYGPITDNAGGIAEMAGLPDDVREITDALDAVGNTTKAVTKGFAIGSAALAALTFFAAYVEELKTKAVEILNREIIFKFDLGDPYVLVGLFIGALIPFLFSAMAIKAVSLAAFDVVNEVRRQFRELRILEGIDKPEYGKCVSIVTGVALKKMSAPALLAVLSPVVVGLVLGPIALGGLLVGSIVSGLMLALMMANGGAAWDNAKKFVEAGNLGGKGSDTHKATVVGDTVGDPLKDTAGPAINPLIKVMNTLALLIVPIIIVLKF